jgi:hypothetical protein
MTNSSLLEEILDLEINTSSSHCPLCARNNSCGNLLSNSNTEACWCTHSSITFSDSLLSQVLDVDKNKACICKACALKHEP